ncbi:DUF29 domain-containing protein [uncultured Gammaproteobacteria bacterium]
MLPTPYEADFYTWTQEQAAALRRVASLRINLPDVDLEHLAEEVEDMGNEILAKIEGLVVQILVHLLKLEYCPDAEPRHHWRCEIDEWRDTVMLRAQRSPTALKRLEIERLSIIAIKRLRRRYCGQTWTGELPDHCPYTSAQILDEDFWPASRHRLDDT